MYIHVDSFITVAVAVAAAFSHELSMMFCLLEKKKEPSPVFFSPSAPIRSTLLRFRNMYTLTDHRTTPSHKQQHYRVNFQ